MLKEEDTEQIKVVEFIKQCTSLPVIHIANQRATTPAKGFLLKRMGVRAGVSDLFLPRCSSNGIYKGLWIELKTKTGKASKVQLEFINDMILEGYAAHVCYGADEAILVIKSFYGIK